MNKAKLELMLIIANRGLADRIVEELSSLATFPSIVRSRGTATSEILAALGIGEPEKELILCFTTSDNVEPIYDTLCNELDFKEKKLGIALTIPISAVGGNLTLQILLGKTKDLL